MSALHALLDEGLAYDPVYARELANHLPMALIALDRLSATAEQLERYAASYARRKKLRPARPTAAWPAGEAWTSRLGQPDAWPSYRDLFVQWLRHEPASAVLRKALPALMPGCVAAAIADEDEHVIKLVDSCREHERATAKSGEDLWRRAATRAVARR